MHKRLIPLALAFVGDETPIDGRTRLQKMVFVIQQELKKDNELRDDQQYDFFAYDYGPFSKELAVDIDRMIEGGLLDEDEVEYSDEGDIKYTYSLEAQGKTALKQDLGSQQASEVLDVARRIKERYNEELTLPDVIEEVYSEYPEFAEHSVY